MKQIVYTVMLAMLFSGCAATKPTADEQLAQAIQYMEETNSTAVIYQQERSHGLFGDMIDKTFKTIRGQNNDKKFHSITSSDNGTFSTLRMCG